MKILRLITIITIAVLPLRAFAQEKPAHIPSLLIYNFNVINMTPEEENEKKTSGNETAEKTQKNYQYYSFIIPQTIFKNLTGSGKYNIKRKLELLSIKKDFTSKDRKKEYIRELRKTGKQNSADYLITGTCRVFSDRLEIDGAIFNVRGRDIEFFQTKSFELGVLLKETTDVISDEIDQKVQELTALNAERFRPSPFRFLASPLGITAVGVNAGYLKMTGDWSDTYNDAAYMSPFIKFDINRFMKISLKYEYFYSDTEDKNTSNYSEIDIRSVYAGIDLLMPITESFMFGLSAGGGASRTVIHVEADQPFVDPLAREESTDPCAEAAAFIKYRIHSLEIDGGAVYKRIFYEKNALNMAGLYGGISLHF